MELVYGQEERAIKFIENITGSDRIAVLSHDDVDGFVAGRLFEESLNIKLIKFLTYAPGLIERVIPIIKDNNINKIIFTDINLEEYKSDIKKLDERAEILAIDHHEYAQDLNSDKVILIKTKPSICASYSSYQLLQKYGAKNSNIDWLVATAVISDYTFEGARVFVGSIEKKYKIKDKAINNAQAYQSSLGKICTTINNSIIYFKDDLEKFYSLFKNVKNIRDVKLLEQYAIPVQEEIDRIIDEFENNSENINDNLFYLAKMKYKIASAVSVILSIKHPDKTILFLSDAGGDRLKISARRQDGKVNLPRLLTRALDSLDEATSGGHIKAAGGSFLKKDFATVKKRILDQNSLF